MNFPVSLPDLIAQETATSVSGNVEILAAAILKKGNAAAILFYGSGLWKEETADTVYDFYVLTDRYRQFDTRLFPAFLGYLLAPNVYYMEINHSGQKLRCKYALMRVDQFLTGAKGYGFTPQIWARFAQPCRIIYAKNENMRLKIRDAIVDAVLTFHRFAVSSSSEFSDSRQLWLHGLGLTYGTELRSEKAERTKEIFDANASAFSERTKLALPLLKAHTTSIPHLKSGRYLQKLIAFLRLLKATLTFDGAVDYALWKVERQSGFKFQASNLQRRYPLIFGWPLIWKIYKARALR